MYKCKKKRDLKRSESSFSQSEAGRYYVTLSLFEAECMRAVIYQQSALPLVPGTDAAVALRTERTILAIVRLGRRNYMIHTNNQLDGSILPVNILELFEYERSRVTRLQNKTAKGRLE
jgi:hypothetical protein